MPRIPRPLRRDGKLAVIASCPLFSACNTTTIVDVGKVLELNSWPAGTIVADADGPKGSCGVVVAGHALAVQEGEPAALLGPLSTWNAETTVVALTTLAVLDADSHRWAAALWLVPTLDQSGVGAPSQGKGAPWKNRAKSPSTPAPCSVMPPSTTMV